MAITAAIDLLFLLWYTSAPMSWIPLGLTIFVVYVASEETLGMDTNQGKNPIFSSMPLVRLLKSPFFLNLCLSMMRICDSYPIWECRFLLM